MNTQKAFEQYHKLRVRDFFPLFLIGLIAGGLVALMVGCGTPTPVGQIGVGVDPAGNLTNITGGLTWSPTTNIDLTVSGSFDPIHNQWGGNLMITFKEVPDDATRIQLGRLRAVHIANAPGFAFLVASRARSFSDPELQTLLACAAGSPGGYTLQRLQ
jgi:hypothetical protein